MSGTPIPVLLIASPAVGWPDPSPQLRQAERLMDVATREYGSAGPHGAPGYVAAAHGFLDAAQALRAAGDPHHRETALKNREIAYRNAASAWSCTTTPEVGAAQLERIDDSELAGVLGRLITDLRSGR